MNNENGYKRLMWVCYSRAIEAAPAMTSGPSSRNTTQSGGQDIVTVRNSNGYIVDGNGAVKQGNNLVTGQLIMGGSASGWIVEHPGGDLETSETENHKHEVSIPPHSHRIHTHAHFIDHEHRVSIPPHSHGMDHTHTIPSHTHDIEHGIFAGPIPTTVTVKVDGNVVPNLGTTADEVDIIPYMSKDDSGRIKRGAWHTVEIIPNNLGRVVANILTQLFVQSRGGGNY